MNVAARRPVAPDLPRATLANHAEVSQRAKQTRKTGISHSTHSIRVDPLVGSEIRFAKNAVVLAETFVAMPYYVLAVEAMSGSRISAIGVEPGRDEIVVRHDLIG